MAGARMRQATGAALEALDPACHVRRVRREVDEGGPDRPEVGRRGRGGGGDPFEKGSDRLVRHGRTVPVHVHAAANSWAPLEGRRRS